MRGGSGDGDISRSGRPVYRDPSLEQTPICRPGGPAKLVPLDSFTHLHVTLANRANENEPVNEPTRCQFRRFRFVFQPPGPHIAQIGKAARPALPIRSLTWET